MTAATARRVAALRARAEHAETPEHEAELARELLAKLDPEPTIDHPDACAICLAMTKDPAIAVRWQWLIDQGYARVCCGVWVTS
ncbi:hypothetical protein GO011_11570 [Mycobacterium sp. 20091114027_K0903767]|nr:hypothetical protein [Mycobacterium sp. 20091114027_K0903767]